MWKSCIIFLKFFGFSRVPVQSMFLLLFFSSNYSSVKFLFTILDICMASPQYERECVLLDFRSVKILHHTHGVCMVSPQYECAYAFWNSPMCKNPVSHSFQERDSYPVWMYKWCLKSLLNENIALQAWHSYGFFFQHESAYAFSNPRVLSVKCWVLSVEC